MLQQFSFMSPLVLFGKQLLITASCPGTKTHFRSSHSKLNEHHIPHLPPAQHPPSTTFQPRQRTDTVWPDNKNPSLRVSSPACRMFNHPPPTLQHLTANIDSTLKTAMLRQPLRPSATTQVPTKPQGHSPCHLKNSLLLSLDSS